MVAPVSTQDAAQCSSSHLRCLPVAGNPRNTAEGRPTNQRSFAFCCAPVIQGVGDGCVIAGCVCVRGPCVCVCVCVPLSTASTTASFVGYIPDPLRSPEDKKHGTYGRMPLPCGGQVSFLGGQFYRAMLAASRNPKYVQEGKLVKHGISLPDDGDHGLQAVHT